MKLSLIYDKRQKDFVVRYPNSRDGGLVLYHLVSNILRWKAGSPGFETYNFIKDLEARGYDPTTLKFSIEEKERTHVPCGDSEQFFCWDEYALGAGSRCKVECDICKNRGQQ